MAPDSISEYLRAYGSELGQRVLDQFPPLHGPSDPVAPELRQLKRHPFPAQSLAIMGIVKRWAEARCAAAVAECGTGKTLISLGSVFSHAEGRPFTALAMVPPQLVEKWARECFLTLPGVRVFLIDGVRNGVGSNGFSGVNEVRFRTGRIVREGFRTSLSDMRLAKSHRSARARWRTQVPAPAVFVVSRERAKLGYYWRHVIRTAASGPFLGSVVNPDTGRPIISGEDQLRRADFRKVRHAEVVSPEKGSDRSQFYSPLWQADNQKSQRMAPIEFIGRYLKGFFDYGIADEVHELKGETAQGNALGTLASACDRTIILTGTLLGGYADELFNILYRLDPRTMRNDGFEYGEGGIRQFAEAYGVLEKVTTIEAAENSCSKAKVTTTVKRRPGASPLLFGKYLMNLAAFVSLEDISDALPPYIEEVVSVEMDPALKKAYTDLENDIRDALREHHGNSSVISTAMNALLLYPDRPFGLGKLYGFTSDPETGERERFLIADPPDLDQECTYKKERRLIDEIRTELSRGRKVQVFVVYTQKRDVTRRLQSLLSREGIRAEVLTADTPPEQREAWYERQLRSGMQVCICHPRLVQTGLDLLEFPTILFYETGYSTYVLRQASRRSWRIGQKRPVRVGFLTYAGAAALSIAPTPIASVLEIGSRVVALLQQAQEVAAGGELPDSVLARLADAVESLRSRLVRKTERDPRSLFDLDDRLIELMDRAEEASETGEIPAELLQEINDYIEAFRTKVDRIAAYWRWQESIAKICGEEAERLTSRKRASERRVTRLKEMLLAFMLSRGLKKLEGEKAAIGLQANGTAALVVDDPLQIGERFFENTIRFAKTELQEIVYQLADGDLRRRLESALTGDGWEINGSAVRFALTNNAAVSGARLVKGHHVRLR